MISTFSTSSRGHGLILAAATSSLSLSLSSSNFLFLSLFTVAAGTAEIYRIGTYAGTETR